MKRLIVIVIFFSVNSLSINGQTVNEFIKKGNDLFREKQYEQSAEQYQKAIDADPASFNAKFNLASSLYKLDKQEEASKIFAEIANNAKEAELRSKAFYNKGVQLSRQKKLEESIASYKDALRQDPDDKEARENLQKALLELKKKNPPKKNEEKENKKKQQPRKQQSKMSPKEAEQRLKLLEQKEKEVQQRLQKEKSKSATTGNKDW